MGLEAVTYIADLVATNPIGASDPKSEGDDHIRNIKKALQNCFPSLSGQVFRKQAKAVNYAIALTDNLSWIDATAAINLTFLAANTLGNGFMMFVRGNGFAATLVPNGTDLINGVNANFVIPAGYLGVVLSDNAGIVCFLLLSDVNAFGVPTGAMIDYPITGPVPTGYLECDGSNVLRSTYAALFGKLIKSAAVTMTIASPCLVTWAAHGLQNGDVIKFSTTGALPTGIVAGTTYYLINKTANDFNIAATEGGAAIATSGAQSGVHTGTHAPFGTGDGVTTFGVPDSRRRVTVGRGGSGTVMLTTHVGSIGGEETHLLLLTELISHTHGPGGGNAFVDTTVAGGGSGFSGGNDAISRDATTAATGGSQPFNVRDPALVVTKIIKT